MVFFLGSGFHHVVRLAKKFFPPILTPALRHREVKLPDGTVVQNGMVFRNTFHTSPYAKATIFVPCGGRPESINVENVVNLLGMRGFRTRLAVYLLRDLARGSGAAWVMRYSHCA
jgi:hypothetical protein